MITLLIADVLIFLSGVSLGMVLHLRKIRKVLDKTGELIDTIDYSDEKAVAYVDGMQTASRMML